MEKIDNILVALDLTMIDQNLIKCAKMVKEYQGAKEIIFTHVMPENFIHENSMPEIKMFGRKQQEVIAEDLHEQIKEAAGEDFQYRLILKSGSPFSGILETSIAEDVDLIIVGKKKELKGSGIVPLELSRFAPTSIMFVPEKHKCKLKDIVVCNDFSQFSASAMTEAIKLAGKNPEEISITSLHLHQEKNDYAAVTEGDRSLINKYNNFINDFELDEVHITPKFLPAGKKNICSVINKFASKKNADMIITGSRGTSENNMFMIGSLTERLVRSDLKTTLMVIKPHITDRVLKEELMRDLQIK